MTARVRRLKAYRHAVHWYQLLRYPAYRSSDRAARALFERFCRDEGGLGLSANVLPPGRKRKVALVVRILSLRYAKVEALVMKALQMAGFETIVVGKRQFDVLRYDWLVGNRTGYTFADFETPLDEQALDREMANLLTLQDWLAFERDGVRIGRIVLATVLRSLKVGELDFASPRVQAELRTVLASSIRHAQAADRLLDAVKPDCVVFMDRGYAGQGEIYDLAINRGIEALTWDVGYKSNRLVFKRYHAGNRRDHPLMPSADSWRRLCDMPWKPEYGERVRSELFDCYQTQDWFSVVGTQFGKDILSKEKTRQQLGIRPDRKVAVIFPHILWDGSFFFGDDLFDNYGHWLLETIRAACANDGLQWVVKLHPAHLVKARVEGDPNKPSEVQAIEAVFGTLPPHVILVYPDTNVSTYSLFEIADYTVTVRGTVGIESGLFGIPTVTAGTSRYAGRGFTLDSATREEYLQKLASLETYPRLTDSQRELAERYAYGVFLCRPFTLSSASLEFARDGVATPQLTIRARTRDEWLAAPDMQRLAHWLSDGRSEDMLSLPDTP